MMFFRRIFYRLSEFFKSVSEILKPNILFIPDKNGGLRIEKDLTIDPCVVFFHLSEQLVDDVYDYHVGDIFDDDPEVVKQILEIKGIKSVTIMPYDIVVEKSIVYKWAEFLSTIEDLVIGYVKKERLTSLSKIQQN